VVEFEDLLLCICNFLKKCSFLATKRGEEKRRMVDECLRVGERSIEVGVFNFV